MHKQAHLSGLLIQFLIRYSDNRDVSTGATGATAVAPKFSDSLTLSPPVGRFCPPSQRLQLNFPHVYVPAQHNKKFDQHKNDTMNLTIFHKWCISQTFQLHFCE